MCESKQDDLNLWITDFLKKRRFSKYELELTGNSSKGDGYLGEVTFVKVITGIGREEEKIYNLVIKSAKKSDEFRKKTPIKEVFEREMYMYNKVFPEFHSFQLEQAVQNPFMKYAKCYSIYNESHKEAIILQNLKYLEYDTHDRKTAQNLDHTLFVISNYGKFHAISLALKKQKPDLYKKLTENMSDLLFKFVMQANMIESMAKKFQEANDLLRNEYPESYKKLSKFSNKDVLKEALCKDKEPADGISVILHGDCWNNNMMFTYKDISRKKPSDMMFLDFQLSSIGSPIYDLSYYLYTVADEHVLKYHDLLLQTYHYSLTSFLNELNEYSYNITLEDIKRHWAEYGKFGLAMAPMLIKIELSESDEVVDIAESAETGDISSCFDTEIKNTKDYVFRVKAVLKHYATFLK